MKLRSAARVICRSSNKAWSRTNRLRSRFRRCTLCMRDILTMHVANGTLCHPMKCQRTQAMLETKKENKHAESSDHYWCLWWNRRLDRKTSGKRRVCGGGELRRKSSSGAVFSGGCQGCGGTRHRCASRCGDCRRRGAALQRVDGSFRQARCGDSLCGHHAAVSHCQWRRGRLRQSDRDQLARNVPGIRSSGATCSRW